MSDSANRPPTSRKTRVACWALFLLCLVVPHPLPGFPFRLLHGLEMFNTGNVMEARGGPWPFFAMRDLTFVLLPAFAVLLAFAVRRLRAWKALACSLALGLLGCGIRHCYVPEFEFIRGFFRQDFLVRTRHRPEFDRNAFLRLPTGSTREEVRARIGDGYSCMFGLGHGSAWGKIAEWDEEFKKGVSPEFLSPDSATCWQMTVVENSGSYWRCWVSFDGNGRLDGKYIGWWWD